MTTVLNQQQDQQPTRTQKKPFAPHILSEKEINELPAEEKTELVSMPVEPNSIWSEHISAKGQAYYNTPAIVVKRVAPTFFQMLEAIVPSEKSHLVFGDFCFSLGTERVTRSKYYAKTGGLKAPWTSKSSAANAPKYVSKVLIARQDEVNDFLSQEENKNQWQVYGDWKIDSNGNVIIGLVQYHSSN